MAGRHWGGASYDDSPIPEAEGFIGRWRPVPREASLLSRPPPPLSLLFFSPLFFFSLSLSPSSVRFSSPQFLLLRVDPGFCPDCSLVAASVNCLLTLFLDTLLKALCIFADRSFFCCGVPEAPHRVLPWMPLPKRLTFPDVCADGVSHREEGRPDLARRRG